MKANPQKWFFDRPKVRRAVDRARRQSLSKAGAYIRTRARTSIRRRKGVSAPGSPPHSHEGTLRRLIFFGYDPAAGSVVVGPAATNQVFFNRHRQPVRGTVPEVLEYGGEITILEVEKWPGFWTRADLRSRRRLAGKRTRCRRVRVAARPYMWPAFEAERNNIPRHWRNSVRAA